MNDCPECGHELCEHSSNNPIPGQKLNKLRDYANGLRTWAKTNKELEIATDILYLIEEN